MVRGLLGDFDLKILFGAWRSVKVKVGKGMRKSLLNTVLLALVI